MGIIKAIHAGQVTTVDTTAIENLGTPRLDPSNGKTYVYVKNVSGAALDVGEVVYQDDAEGFSKFEVNHDDNAVTLQIVAGVAVSDIPDDGYGWVQVGGYCDNIRDKGDVNAGDPIMRYTDKGECYILQAGSEHLVFGFALTDSTTTTAHPLAHCTGFLTNCLFGF